MLKGEVFCDVIICQVATMEKLGDQIGTQSGGAVDASEFQEI